MRFIDIVRDIFNRMIPMSKIIPFEALLPVEKFADKIICPPYDVISSDEARKFAAGNPKSFLRIAKAEVDFPPDVSEYDDRVYRRAAENLAAFQKDGWLTRDAASLYIYRLEMGGHIQTGVACAASVDEYDDGRIKRHEKTRKEKEDDRTKVALTLSAHAEPVILTFRSVEKVKKLIAAEATVTPLYDLTDRDGVRHVIWRARAAGEIVKAFAEVDALYIADGHHRSAASSRVREALRVRNKNHRGDELYNFFPAVIFPHDEVIIYRYDWEGDPKERPLADCTIEDVMKLADASGIMPPKSTWFAPKLASGLFVYDFLGTFPGLQPPDFSVEII